MHPAWGNSSSRRDTTLTNIGPRQAGLESESEPIYSECAFLNSLAASSAVYEWISWNSEKKEGTYVTIPERLQIPENIKEQLIVELYSK